MGVWRGWASAFKNEVLISELKWESAGAVDGDCGPDGWFGGREGFLIRENHGRLRVIYSWQSPKV